MLNILSQMQISASSKIRYLVPFEWWQQILIDNKALKNINDLQIFYPLNINNYIQNIDHSQKQSFLKHATEKINFLQIDNLILNYKLKSKTKWKLISQNLCNLIKNKIGSSFILPFKMIDESQNYHQQQYFIAQNIQFKLVKLLLCSSTQNHLFYGYIQTKISLFQFMKELINLFQYFFNHKTKITFMETNQYRNYIFQNFSIQSIHQKQLIMIHGLQRYDQYLQQKIQQKDYLPEYFIQSFQNSRIARIQRNGQQLTMADEDSRTLSDHTMSTGAQTPFTFAIEDQDWDLFRPYQNYGLFGQKLYQQIQHMKQYARQAIYSDIIEFPISKQQIMVRQLQKLAEDLQQNIQKRKMYQKELAKDSKQFYKQSKQNVIYLNHFREKDDNFLIKERQLHIFGNKQQNIKDVKEKELNQSKAKQKNISVVHYVKGLQNN